jgi:DNA-binding Lrp family transcriptional regulator
MTRAMAAFSSNEHTVAVDAIDLSILRWMFPGGVFSYWSADPRISPTQIASHVGLDRTTIWDRLQNWRREGFWGGFDVRLNPATVGMQQFRFQIRVADPAEGLNLFNKLEHVEGVIWAGVGFGDTSTERNVELVALELIADSPAHLRRSELHLRRLSPTGTIGGPFPAGVPSCSRKLTPLDWRIIAAIVADPEAGPDRLAHLVGVTPKTFDRHLSALIEDHAVGYLPRLDWSKLGCVCLAICCRDTGDVDRVQRAVEARFHHLIPMDLKGIENVSPGWDESTCFGVIVPARSPHEVQSILRDVSEIDGARMVRPEYWGAQRLFTGWVSQRIAEHLPATAAAEPTVIPPTPGRRSRGHGNPSGKRYAEVRKH